MQVRPSEGEKPYSDLPIVRELRGMANKAKAAGKVTADHTLVHGWQIHLAACRGIMLGWAKPWQAVLFTAVESESEHALMLLILRVMVGG